LTFVGETLSFTSNATLTDITGFTNLTSVGTSLTISSNPLLTVLIGFTNLTSIGDDLLVVGNPMLSDCCLFCPLLMEDQVDSAVIGDRIIIDFNASGCSSQGVLACSPCARPIECDAFIPVFAPNGPTQRGEN